MPSQALPPALAQVLVQPPAQAPLRVRVLLVQALQRVLLVQVLQQVLLALLAPLAWLAQWPLVWLWLPLQQLRVVVMVFLAAPQLQLQLPPVLALALAQHNNFLEVHNNSAAVRYCFFMRHFFVKLVALVALALTLPACVLRPVPSFQAVPDYFRASGSSVAATLASGKLNPQLTYLHITLGTESPALMVLGYVDAAPAPQSPLLTWYSATGQTLQTQQGRVVGLYGLHGAPAQVRYQPSPLDWPTPQQPQQLQRVWDVPSLYQYGLSESRSLTAIAATGIPASIQRHLAQHLLPYVPSGKPAPGAPTHPNSWSWFVESGPSGPVSWYATAAVQGSTQMVYSYQCITAQMCLHIAPWPLAGVVLP